MEALRAPPHPPPLHPHLHLTSSSSLMTLAWALLKAWSRISMCLLWSSLAVRTAANSISNFSFSFKNSLSRRKTRTKPPLSESTHPLGSLPGYIWQGLTIKKHVKSRVLNYCFCSLLTGVACEGRNFSNIAANSGDVQAPVPQRNGTQNTSGLLFWYLTSVRRLLSCFKLTFYLRVHVMLTTTLVSIFQASDERAGNTNNGTNILLQRKINRGPEV